ncbi:cytochrome P450 [Lactarius akahatsu]|uniref:Cytochrome P450 n=1 Tax=Lactarius akahatsu TaxID=416441 RepID=A0AAD4LAY1_9AGAM|nr:cytochrome P450 [Lactarius akahatsu]
MQSTQASPEVLSVESFSSRAFAWTLVISFCVPIFFHLVRRRQNVLPFPPGPEGLPVVGNVLDMPSRNQWLTYCRWGKQYNSDIVHAKVLGTHVIVLNSTKATCELFEKRSSLYSDRPPLPSLTQLIRMSWNIAFLPYGPRWRTWRKVFHEHFHPQATRQYLPRELKATRQLLVNLLRTPNNYRDHLRFMSGQIIMGIAYGIDIAPRDDPYISLAERALQAVESASITGWTFDMLPFYMYLPWWFPGASFKKEAAILAPHIDEMLDRPYRAVKDALAKGIAVPSVAASMITGLRGEPSHEDELTSKAVPATMYLGGADTTASAFLTFFLAMVLHPNAQRRAQMEIDRVVGTARLPDFDDETTLPYVSALVKEVMRWHPVAPIAVPHRLAADDIYEGYFLPAGSIVIGNTWALLHDESVFPEPNRFWPERFLDPDVKLPDAVFGFGRRICPGRFMARSSMWITIASVLAAFEISPTTDGDGVPLMPAEDFTTGLISYPEAFACAIRPRSKCAEGLIVAAMDAP